MLTDEQINMVWESEMSFKEFAAAFYILGRESMKDDFLAVTSAFTSIDGKWIDEHVKELKP